MSGDLEPAGLTESLAGGARWAAIVVFAAVTAAGAVWLNPNAPVAVAGAIVAVGAAIPLVLGWRPVLIYAAVATAGIAMLGHGMSSNLGWFAVCLLAGWCVLAGSRREAPGRTGPGRCSCSRPSGCGSSPIPAGAPGWPGSP